MDLINNFMYIDRGYGTPKKYWSQRATQEQFWYDCQVAINKREYKKAIRRMNRIMRIEVSFWTIIYICIVGYTLYEKIR